MKHLAVGTKIENQYVIAGSPLEGGMGAVYPCYDIIEKRPVALKTFKSELLSDRSVRAHFLSEADAWIKLGSHPHIVRCYEVLYSEPNTYLALELIAPPPFRINATLRSWLIHGYILPLNEILTFSLQIIRGMQYACTKIPGFVHLDLKPENLLVGADKLLGTKTNRLRVTDFGLMTSLEKSAKKANTIITELESQEPTNYASKDNRLSARVMGTPLYMAPEQWRKQSLGLWTDIYAFGCIMYEMSAGQHVVKGNDIKSLYSAHCKNELQPLPIGTPKLISNIIYQCLSLDPQDRFASWDKIEAALEEVYFETYGKSPPNSGSEEEIKRTDRIQIGYSHLGLGTSYLGMGDLRSAIPFFEKALEIGNLESSDDLIANSLNNIGRIYQLNGNAESAIEFAMQAIEISQKAHDESTEMHYKLNLAVAYKNTGNFNSAIELYNVVLNYFRVTGFTKEMATTLGNLGVVYRLKKDHKNALEYMSQALALDEKHGYRVDEARDSVNLGNIYGDIGDISNAKRYFEKGLSIIQEIGGDDIGQFASLNGIGQCFSSLKEFQTAIDYYKKALGIARNLSSYHEGFVLANIGQSYFMLNDVDNSILNFEKALSLLSNTENLDLVAGVSYRLAMLYYVIGKISEAKPLAKKAETLWRKIGSPQEMEARELLLMWEKNKS